MKAKLRCCASCEWIYEGSQDCPKCGFGSYGARFVYGSKAYRYKLSQEPWKRRKVNAYLVKLQDEINAERKGNQGE